MTDDPQTQHHTQNLWARADGCLQAFAMLFAPPRNLMDNHFLSRAEARAARAFLRGLEALVRRLLLVRALVILPGLAPARPARRKPQPTHTRLHPFDLPEHPEHWPTRFAYRLTRLIVPRPEPDDTTETPATPPSPPRAKPCRIGCQTKAMLGRRAPCPPNCPKLKTPADPHRSFVRSAPTALRAETLRRIIETPEPYARRLAHQIRRRANTRANRQPAIAPPPNLKPDHQRFLLAAINQSQRLATSALAPPHPPDTS